jgi:hypothetical protein
LELGDRWAGLWKDAGQLLDYACKRRLTEWLPHVKELPKAPIFNVPGRQPAPTDKAFKTIDDNLREIARAVRCLHLTLQQDPSLPKSIADTSNLTGQPLQVPPLSVQIENIFVLLGSCSVYCDNCRLHAIDSRLEFEVKEEEGLVGKSELARLEQAQRLMSKMPGQKSGKGNQKYHPYHSQNSKGNGNKGKGKGRGFKGGKGKGKGKGGGGFVFPKPADP